MLKPVETSSDDKKGKPKSEKMKKCIRTAAGTSWEDASLLEWEAGSGTCLSSRPRYDVKVALFHPDMRPSPL